MNGSCRQCQLFFLMNKLRDLRIADFPYLGAAKLRKKLVLQDRFIIGKSTVLDGIADFLFPVFCGCFEGSLVIQNARVSHQMSIAWHFCNFFVSFVLYFAICFAIEGTVVDFSLRITVFDITGFPAPVLAFAYVFTFSAHSCLLIL